MAPSLRDQRAAAVAVAGQRRLATLAGRVGTGLANAFLVLDGLTSEHLDAWLSFAVPLAEAGQRAAVSMSYAHAAIYANLAGVGFNDAGLPLPETVTGPALRQGVSVADVYTRPMITARTMASEGHDFTDAMATGAARAAATGRTDVGLAWREAQRVSLDVTEGVAGYVRVPASDACKFCQLIATRTYDRADLAPVHANCGCSVAPVFDRLNPAAVTVTSALARLGLSANPATAADQLDRMELVDTETGPSPREVT